MPENSMVGKVGPLDPYVPLPAPEPTHRRPGGTSRFTDDQRDRILKALVLANMKPKLARRRLERDSIVVSERTLRAWKNEYAAELETLANQRQWVTQGQAEDFEALSDELLSVSNLALQELAKRSDWDKVTVGSLGNLIRSLVTSSAIATDKARLLRDMPTIITEHRDLPSLLNALSKFSNVVNVNPDLIPEAEVVEETVDTTPELEAAA